MFGLFKRNKSSDEPPASWFTRLKKGLQRTRTNLGAGIATLFLGKKQIDQALLEEIETHLLLADVGVQASQKIIKELTEQVSRKALTDSEALYPALQQCLYDRLQPVSIPLEISSEHKPTIILMIGVNGSGKTTTIGKLARRLQQEGRSVLLAAGDTFRAAAVEQLQVWGQRNDIPVISQGSGADSASVIFDAIQAAKAREIDVVIADTAGRLHTQNHLMDELKKVLRVIQKLDPSAPHEVMLVLDSSIGQNALAQAQTFNQAVKVTGITLTKLDGTAKGGMIIAIAEQLGIPIRFIGVGEGIEDLQPFDASAFVEALFDQEPI